MKILAVDTSCDESCAAILNTTTWKLESDVIHSHVGAMKRYGGVVPEIASREHLKALPLAVSEALERASLRLNDIDWVAVTNRPGLIGALLVGVSFTKALAYALGRPFSVLNHIEAHLFSPLLALTAGTEPPPFPWIALVVSGGHTELFFVKDKLDYRWLGGTLDDAAGEAFDKIGKLLGMNYPAGPAIDRIVRERGMEADRTAFRFPRSKTPENQFSFSGLKTAVSLQIQKMALEKEEEKFAILASAQEAILDPLVEKARLAQKSLGANQIVVTGGVACNSRLRAKMPEAYYPPPRHCSDNAAMVALLAALYHQAGKLEMAPLDTSACSASRLKHIRILFGLIPSPPTNSA